VAVEIAREESIISSKLRRHFGVTTRMEWRARGKPPQVKSRWSSLTQAQRQEQEWSFGSLGVSWEAEQT